MTSRNDETPGLTAVMMLEVIGMPPEHLTKTLEEIIGKIDSERKVNVVNKKISEPILIKDQKDFYTTFAEVEIEVEEILQLIVLMFKYMPAHIEIISPELIVLSNNGWNDALNELTRRLHGYDEVARVLQNEKLILEKKLTELMDGKKVKKKPVKKKIVKKKKKSK